MKKSNQNNSHEEKNEIPLVEGSSLYKDLNTDETGFSLPKSCSDGLRNKTRDTNTHTNFKSLSELQKGCGRNRNTLITCFNDRDFCGHYNLAGELCLCDSCQKLIAQTQGFLEMIEKLKEFILWTDENTPKVKYRKVIDKEQLKELIGNGK